MPPLRLYYFPGNANLAPHILLEEMGVPFELQLVDRNLGAHKSPAYLRLNPNGLIPVLTDGDLVLYEAAAIGLHLVDTHPDAGLAPPIGTPERAHFYKWLVWLTNTLQPAHLLGVYAERWVDEGNADAAAQVRAHARARVGALLEQLDAQLAGHGGDGLLGARYSAVDPYVFMLCRWTRAYDRPARDLPHLGPYLRRLLERPAVQRAIASEQLPQPWI
jgi:glutathione S-transferase